MTHGKERSEVFRQDLAKIRSQEFRREALAKIGSHWPLWLVLIVQTVLTVRNIVRNGIFNDEALYIQAGREEWAGWLHSPAAQGIIPSHYSGSPYLWPPLAYAGYHVAMIDGARFISLALMLTATTLTYFIGLHLGGRIVAGFGAAFAALTPLTADIGASATFEPLAIAFMLAGLLVILRSSNRWYLLILGGLLLSLADMAKYGMIAYTPFVVAVAVIADWEGWLAAARRAGIIIGSIFAGILGQLYLSRFSIWAGIIGSTLARPAVPYSKSTTCPAWTASASLWCSPASVLSHGAQMLGILFILGCLGVIFACLRHEWQQVALISLMTLAILVAPVDQARLHQLGSLDRNMTLSLPLGALAAAFGVSYIYAFVCERRQNWVPASRFVAVVPLAALLIYGLGYHWQDAVPRKEIGRQLRVAAYVERVYSPGTYVAIDTPGTANIYRLFFKRIPDNSWVLTEQPAKMIKLLAQGKVSLAIITYYKHKPGSESAALHFFGSLHDWKLAHTFGHGSWATYLWRKLRGKGLRDSERELRMLFRQYFRGVNSR